MLERLRERHKERMGEGFNKAESVKNIFSLETLRNLKIAYIPYNELLKEGFFAGLGWAFGVTVGFVLVSTLIVAVLQSLGGLPFIGNFIANIVTETQSQLIKRTPFVPQ